MMVGDDDVDSGATEPRYRCNGTGTAITGHYDLCFRRDRRVDAGITQVVSVFDPPRNERHRLAAEPANRSGEDRRRADSVDVVISVDEHQLLLPYGTSETLDCLVHREKAERIVQTIQLGAQKELRIFGRDIAANEQQAADDF